MITAAQLRAARGLMDWTRSDLAKAANVSPETIKNIEHGTFRPQETTAEAIVKAFALHGVEFTSDEGVKRCHDTVAKYEGIEGFKRFMDDVYTVAERTSAAGDDAKPFCMSNLDDSFFVKYLGDFFTVHHIRRMNALRHSFKMRILIKEKPHSFSPEETEQGSYREYRLQPDHAMGNVPFYVYGDKLAILVFEEQKEPRIVVIASALVAKAYREQFDILWEAATPRGRSL
ncbi:MAG: helix-turn-helix transcriptional regulator [Alphaproteobacteria bacterium]|nr:helix-turn-helix transcriptional regulator [Alphaproteobacteria bacterium]